MKKAQLRMALIGAGGIGKTHLSRYADVADAKIVAVCDANEEAARTAAAQVDAQAFTDAGAMFDAIALDAVDICTPTAAHRQPAIEAIQHGLHVLCEKPLGDSPDAAREIVDAAAAKGVHLMTAFCHRFHPSIVFVKKLIDDGEMGEVVMFRNRFAGFHEGIEHKWFSHKAVSGGGAMLDTSIHSVDLFRHLVGEISRVQSVVRQTNPAITQVEDTAIALLSTADDRMGVVEACWSVAEGYQVVEIYGTRGAAMIHYWDGFKSRYRLKGMEDWALIDESGPDRFLGEIRHFVDACLDRTPLRVTGRDGLRAVEVVFEAYTAASHPR